MESRAFTVSLTKNPVISTNIIPGHFTTSHFHTNCYVDLDKLKPMHWLLKMWQQNWLYPI